MEDDRIQKFLDYVKQLAVKYYNDPVGLTRELFKVTPTDQQKAIMNAVVKHRKVSVRSGHNIGKSALATWLTFWFLITRSFPKIICSANTKEQLYDVLWAEMNKWKRQNAVVDTLFEWNKEKIFHKGYPEEWWAVARTASKKEGIAGRHAEHQMIIIDEPSGMADDILEATEGLMSGKNIYVLLISNPTRPSGFFYETQMNRALEKHWHPMHFSSLDSPLPAKDWLEYMLDKYGVNSPVYMVRVLGEFPIDSEDTLIQREWVMNAVDKQFPDDPYARRIIGVDVGAGGDKSVIVHRKGSVVDRIVKSNTSDTMKLVDIISDEYNMYHADAVCIDSIGIGKGAFDQLRRRGFNTYEVDVRRKSFLRDYDKISDELWWKTRQQFEAGNVSIPNDHDLHLELWSIKYEPGKGTGVKIEKKKEMKKRIKYSPDTAEAFRNTYFLDDTSFNNYPDEEEAYDKMKDIMNQGHETGRSKVTGY